MALPRVGLISPHAGFSASAGDLAGELGVNLVVSEYGTTNMNSMDTVLRKWENGMTVDAVVTGESISNLLQGKTGLPVLTVRVSGYDVLEALNRARSMGQRVVLAEYDYFSPRVDLSGFASMLGLDVKPLHYKEMSQLVRMLAKMRNQVDAVVGTTLAVMEGAQEAGIPGFLVQSDPVFIRDALEKAMQICRIRRRNAKLCRSLQAVLDSVYDGIVGVDERGKLAILNPAGEKFTGLTAGEVLGKPLDHIIKSNVFCRELLGDGTPARGQLLSLGGVSFVVNRVPIGEGENTGLVITFQTVHNARSVETRVNNSRDTSSRGSVAGYQFSDIIGQSAVIRETIAVAKKYAVSEAAVLITGESGTGKELMAQSIHNWSQRRNGPFVAINCASLSESLLESELFGYEEGAFTGAKKGGKQGLFALAHGGTIFLDEIGDPSPEFQARLLRVLQQKEVLPVGGRRAIPVDVRVISATNRNLEEAVTRGDFRSDLYYRINVLNLHMPPLRERLEDLPLLFNYFFQRHPENKMPRRVWPGHEILEELKCYPWPGNVRELEGLVERYVALVEDEDPNFRTLKFLLKKLKQNAHARQLIATSDNQPTIMVQLGSMEEMERQIIEQAAELVEGGRGQLAKILGLSRTTLWKKFKHINDLGDIKDVGSF